MTFSSLVETVDNLFEFLAQKLKNPGKTPEFSSFAEGARISKLTVSVPVQDIFVRA